MANVAGDLNSSQLDGLNWANDPAGATAQAWQMKNQYNWTNDDIAGQFNRLHGMSLTGNDVAGHFSKYGFNNGAAADGMVLPSPAATPAATPAPAASASPFGMVGSAPQPRGIIAAATNPGAPGGPPITAGQVPAGGLQAFYNTNKSNPTAVAQYMQQNGITRAQAASQLGIDPGYVDHYFDGNPATSNFGNTGIVSTATQPSSSSTYTASSTHPAQLGNPTPWNVTAPQTVEGRIASIIDPNNPIIQQAQAQARIAAAGQGLQNTSMATTAGQAAAYQAAIPIAQADAATFAKAAGYNADQSNQFSMKNVDSANQFGLTDKQIAGQTGITGMQIAGQKEIAALNSQTQMGISKLGVEAQAVANKLQADNQKLISTNGNAAQSFNQAVAAINQINMNDKMDGAHKAEAVGQVWYSVQSQLQVLGAVSGLNLTEQLARDLAGSPGFDANGTWRGFDPKRPGVTSGADPATTGYAPPTETTATPVAPSVSTQ